MTDIHDSQQLPERRQIRLKDFDYTSPRPYHITICSWQKESFFVNDDFNRQIISCLIEEKTEAGFRLFVYCLMPNHLHLLLTPLDKNISVPIFIGAFKSKTTRIGWNFGIYGKLWQGRFYDHIVRKKEDLKTVGQYILDNPVRKGLVEKWQDYKYCGIPDSWIP